MRALLIVIGLALGAQALAHEYGPFDPAVPSTWVNDHPRKHTHQHPIELDPIWQTETRLCAQAYELADKSTTALKEAARQAALLCGALATQAAEARL